MGKCKACNKEYDPNCDWQQGRCPNHQPLINIQPKDTSKGHFYVSLAKSGLRILAGGCVLAAGLGVPDAPWLIAGGILFVGAEILGIVEEMV